MIGKKSAACWGEKAPTDPYQQLKLAVEAVFKSWNGKRAIDYRNAAGISHDMGTAVSIVAMVFGNMCDDSATGVAMTRNGSTGEKKIEGAMPRAKMLLPGSI